MTDLRTNASITWCPGCGNYQILSAVDNVLKEMSENGFPLENVVLVSGIGNHAKIVDYLHINSFNALHGRAIPAALAIKAANPDLTVLCFVGDGDSYAEGLEHLLFAAKRNADITVIVHNNRTYGLATGQFTPTSQQSFTGVTMPDGAKEHSMNPLELLLASGATFLARSYTRQQDHFRRILKAAINHRGFALVDALQVCITFNNLYEQYNAYVEHADVSDPADRQKALEMIRRWDYRSTDKPIPTGIFYQVTRDIIEDRYIRIRPKHTVDRDAREEIIHNLTGY